MLAALLLCALGTAPAPALPAVPVAPVVRGAARPDVASVVPDTADYDRLLLAAVRGTRVDYAVVARERDVLRRYLAAVAAVDTAALQQAPVAVRAAFQVNAYNATVLDAVVAAGLPGKPGSTVLDVKGFFDTQTHRIAGVPLTLNQLEEQLRAVDPRVHFVVNCAAVDCPPLLHRSYAAATWEQDLDAQTRAFLARPEQLSVDADKGVVTTTQLLEWYGKDFDRGGGIVVFLQRFTPHVVRGRRLVFRPYDWTLNAAP